MEIKKTFVSITNPPQYTDDNSIDAMENAGEIITQLFFLVEFLFVPITNINRQERTRSSSESAIKKAQTAFVLHFCVGGG